RASRSGRALRALSIPTNFELLGYAVRQRPCHREKPSSELDESYRWYAACFGSGAAAIRRKSTEKEKRAESDLRAFCCVRQNGDLPHQLLDLRRFAFGFVSGIRVPAMNALLTESGASPSQVVHGALQLLHTVGEVRRSGRGICHGR